MNDRERRERLALAAGITTECAKVHIIDAAELLNTASLTFDDLFDGDDQMEETWSELRDAMQRALEIIEKMGPRFRKLASNGDEKRSVLQEALGIFGGRR